MKKIFTLVSALFLGATAFGQVVHNAPGITVSPANATGDSEITVVLDLSQICMPAGKEITNSWPSLGFHSGAVVAGAGWTNAVAFDAANTVRFTKVSDGFFTATFTPRTYYGIAAGTDIEGFSFVFNGSTNTPGDWDSEGKAFNDVQECTDFFVLFANLATTNEIDKASNLSVYPNPATDLITFDVDASTFEIVISDLTGKSVKTSTEKSFSVGNLNAGTYIYTVKTNEGIISGKVMKN